MIPVKYLYLCGVGLGLLYRLTVWWLNMITLSLAFQVATKWGTVILKPARLFTGHIYSLEYHWLMGELEEEIGEIHAFPNPVFFFSIIIAVGW